MALILIPSSEPLYITVLRLRCKNWKSSSNLKHTETENYVNIFITSTRYNGRRHRRTSRGDEGGAAPAPPSYKKKLTCFGQNVDDSGKNLREKTS